MEISTNLEVERKNNYDMLYQWFLFISL